MFNIGHKFDCLNRGCLPFKCQSLRWQTNRKNESKKNGGDKINNTHKVNDVKTPKSIPCSTSVSFGVVPGFISFHIDSTLSLFPILSDELPVLLPYPFLWGFARRQFLIFFLIVWQCTLMNSRNIPRKQRARRSMCILFVLWFTKFTENFDFGSEHDEHNKVRKNEAEIMIIIMEMDEKKAA